MGYARAFKAKKNRPGGGQSSPFFSSSFLSLSFPLFFFPPSPFSYCPPLEWVTSAHHSVLYGPMLFMGCGSAIHGSHCHQPALQHLLLCFKLRYHFWKAKKIGLAGAFFPCGGPFFPLFSLSLFLLFPLLLSSLLSSLCFLLIMDAATQLRKVKPKSISWERPPCSV